MGMILANTEFKTKKFSRTVLRSDFGDMPREYTGQLMKINIDKQHCPL